MVAGFVLMNQGGGGTARMEGRNELVRGVESQNYLVCQGEVEEKG